MGYLAFILFVAAIGFVFYRWATRQKRRRRQVLVSDFPVAWRKILQDRVGFYHTLKTEEERQRFEKLV
ncbi:hypothetical protein [Pontibacter flavimaris]|uniref:hypothetical protein n=1 Tax=Pontibacter flavimaris TaxID=1797110 RepID=UPI001F32D810|nr:hypothetical protein [Pontibacter flavimaris]